MSRKVVCVFAALGCLTLAARVANADLVGYWPMNEGQGSLVKDVSGNGHDGTITGTPVWVDGPAGLRSALEFGGANTGVNCGTWNPSTVNDPDGTDVSFTCWVKREAGGGAYQGIVANRTSYGTDDTTINWALEYNRDANFLQFGSRTGTSYGRGALPVGEWVFLAVTFDGQTVSVYQNAGDPSSGGAAYGQDKNSTFRFGSDEEGGNTFSGSIDDLKVYDTILTPAEIAADMEVPPYPYADGPTPERGATDVRLDPTLSWEAGADAVTHDVYFGTSFDDVNAATPSSDLLLSAQAATTVALPSKLAIETIYYWRVDEIDASGAVWKGDVWSFTSEPYSYVVEDISVTTNKPVMPDSEPEKMVDGSGLLPDGGHSTEDDTMWQADGAPTDEVVIDFAFDRLYRLDEVWVWNYNLQYENLVKFGLKDITVEYATEPNEWTTLGQFQLAQGPGTEAMTAQVLDLGGVAAQSVRFVVNSNYGGDGFGLSEVQFRYIPTSAREPEPADGQTDVDLDATLSWRPGREAVSHEVYFSTDSNAVADNTALLATVGTASYDVPALELGKTYYWEIVEVNDAETPTSWASDIWSFSTPEYVVIDDFESYTDEPGQEVFLVWPDGYGIPSNGSQVTYDNPPYMESTIVHGGDQSMPYHYGKGGATTSEATMNVGGANWTAGGAKALVLYFYGGITNTPAQLYVKINGQKIDYPDNSALTKPWWTQWSIDLTSVPGASAVTSLTIGVSGAGQGTLYIDDIRLYASVPATGSEQVWIEAESAQPLVAPWQTFPEPLASGGNYILVPMGSSSVDNPSVSDAVKYQFTVAGGQYRLWFRLGPLIGYSNDSFWVRIAGATSLEPAGNAANPGWVRVNGLAGQPGAGDWHWARIWDDEHGSVQVTFTLPAGTHTLEVSYREPEIPFDLILITNDLEQ